jgi:hypothetical protein
MGGKLSIWGTQAVLSHNCLISFYKRPFKSKFIYSLWGWVEVDWLADTWKPAGGGARGRWTGLRREVVGVLTFCLYMCLTCASPLGKGILYQTYMYMYFTNQIHQISGDNIPSDNSCLPINRHTCMTHMLSTCTVHWQFKPVSCDLQNHGWWMVSCIVTDVRYLFM